MLLRVVQLSVIIIFLGSLFEARPGWDLSWSRERRWGRPYYGYGYYGRYPYYYGRKRRGIDGEMMTPVKLEEVPSVLN